MDAVRPVEDMVSDVSGERWPFRGFGYDYSEPSSRVAPLSAEYLSALELGTFDSATAALGLRHAIEATLGVSIWQQRCRGDAKWQLFCYTMRKCATAECVNVGTQKEDGTFQFRQPFEASILPHPPERCVPRLFEGLAINVVYREVAGRTKFAPYCYPVIGGVRFVLVDLDTLARVDGDPNRFPKNPKPKAGATREALTIDHRRMADVYDGIRVGARHFALRRHLPGILALLERRSISHTVITEPATPNLAPVLNEQETPAAAEGESGLEQLRRTTDHLVVLGTHEDGSDFEAHLDGPDPDTARLFLIRARLVGVPPRPPTAPRARPLTTEDLPSPMELRKVATTFVPPPSSS